MNENNSLEPAPDDFSVIFSQGYVPWVFGVHENNTLAWQWLNRCSQQDGALSCYPNDPNFSLSVDVFTLAAVSLGLPEPTKNLDWLITTTIDPIDGGVRDFKSSTSEKFSNVAGFTVMAILGFPTMLP